MSTTNKYKIETRTQHSAGWTTDGMGAHNEFESAAEARCVVRDLRSLGESWAEAEYRLRGPQGVESAEMDAEAWQYAIAAALDDLGLSDKSNGRSAMVCRIDDDGAVLSDVEDWNKPMSPEDLCAILEAIDAEQSAEEIRKELASELHQILSAHEYKCCAPNCPGFPYRASEIRHPCR